MRTTLFLLLSVPSAGLGGCGDDGAGTDGGSDSGGSDSGGSDSGGSDSGGSDSGGGDGGAPCEPADYVVIERALSDSASGVSFVLRRCMAPICAGGCDAYPTYFSVTHDGMTDVADDRDAFMYMQTHHNWMDSLVATLPDRLLRWRVIFDGECTLTHYVSVETLTGDPLLPDTAVGTTSCGEP